MARELKRRWAVVIYMDGGESGAIVDGWYTRKAVMARLHDYRADPEYAPYVDAMAIVMLEPDLWPYRPLRRVRQSEWEHGDREMLH